MLWLSIQGLYGLGMLKKFVKKVIQHKSPLDAYRYHIDSVNEDVISGWAHKIGDGNYTATIEVRNNNVILFTTQADVAREDLKAAAIGSGQYGFSIDPTKIQPEQDLNTIDIFIDGLKANAKPLPLVLSANVMTKAETSVPAIKETTENSNVLVHLDGISTDKVFGWAKRKDSVTHRSLIELKVEDILLGSDTADTFRQSIIDEGIGDGCYCFDITPSVHLFPSTAINCDLYIDGTKVSTKPIELNADEKTIEQAKFKHEFAGEISGFGDSVNQELARLSSQMNEHNGNSMQVAIENIASLSVRVEVIEQILTKHFAEK
jgi:hypothetical protein